MASFSFPDQDFLTHFFKDKWRPVGWQWNAIKTMRYWHPEIWRDKEVRNCHYICAKPWNEGRAEDGDDAETHGWWWNEWDSWRKERIKEDQEDTVRVVSEFVLG
jgi:inositol 3-alpha-galactosyltransferase